MYATGFESSFNVFHYIFLSPFFFFFHLDDMRKLLITAWRIASLLSPSQYMGFDVYIIGGISD